MTKLIMLTEALKQCAKNYNPKDINEWTERNSFTSMAVDLYCAIEKLGYSIEPRVFHLEDEENDSFLVTSSGE